MAAGFTNAGLNHILSTEFCSGTQVTTWYLGLINNSPSPTFSTADILSSHAGWTETTAYSGNRKAWTNGAAASQATTNSSTVDFAISGTVTVYGLFLCTASSGTSGTLELTASFSGGTQAVASGDTLQSTLTVSAASG